MVAAIHDPATRCSGHARLQCERIAGKSAVTSAFATSPLKLLTPRSRGESIWAYLSSFGGGMVAGDETRLDLHAGPGTRCFVGTQASTKIYRNPSHRPCSHRVHAEAGEDSLLVLAPDPVQSFADSSFSQRQEIFLHPTAGLVLLDWCCSGRVARGERWAFNSYASCIEVFATEAPAYPSTLDLRPSTLDLRPARRLFLDSLLLSPADGPLDAPMRLGRFNCLALLLLLGPPVASAAQQLLADLAARPVERRAPLVVSASALGDGALLRIAGERFEDVARELHSHLAFLPSHLGDDPFARKW
ncbi:MAG: urease accessory protein UreD [Proteobacteria bacterium]|nr:urease accessory protein UreD [Pseudomonadota bacterium]